MFSILMPIYNGIEFIEESVNSVLEQTYKDWELLILINGHPENSEIYQKACEFKDSRIIVYDFFNLKGKSNTLNKGIKLCKYDNVCLLDVDDIWLPTKLEEQFKYLNKYDVIGTLCQYFGEMKAIPTIPLGEIKSKDFIEENPIINSSVCFKKWLGYWRSSVDSVEDFDMWLRLNKLNKKFYNIPLILCKHRIHKNSAFNTSNKQQILKEKILKKYNR